MKFIFLIIFNSSLLLCQEESDNLLENYFQKIYQAENNFFNQKYDSSYSNYIQAFKEIKIVNPKINGFRSDIDNFIQLKEFLPKNNFETEGNFNELKSQLNNKLDFTIDSLFKIDQGVRAGRITNNSNDSLEKIIAIVDTKNFLFLKKILEKDFPLEYSISRKSYIYLKVLLLHAAHIEQFKAFIDSLLSENIYKGLINPRFYINVISLASNRNVGWDVGLIQCELYNPKTKKITKQDKLYFMKLDKNKISEIDFERKKYFLPPVSHTRKSSCFMFYYPNSKLNLHAPLTTFSFSDNREFLLFIKKCELYSCNIK